MSELARGNMAANRPRWMIELIAAWGFAQRNFFLTKRYFLWEVVWSWIEVKTAAIETVKATNIEPPSNKAEMKQAVETITDKTPSTPTPPPTP